MPASPPRFVRRLAVVTGLALAVAMAGAGVTIATRQPAPRGLVATVSGPGGQATCSAAFSPGGTTLAVAGCGGGVLLWDVATRRPIATLASPGCPLGGQVAFSPDGTVLAVGETEPGGDHDHVYLWDLAAGRWAGTLTGPGRGGISSLSFGRDGILAAGADDDHAYLWDVATRRLTAVIVPPVNAAQGNASISKDGTPYPIAGAFDQSTTVAFSPDAAIVAIDASFGYGTYLYDVATGTRVATLTRPGGRPGFAAWIAFSPDGTMMAVTEARGPTYLWDVTENRN